MSTEKGLQAAVDRVKAKSSLGSFTKKKVGLKKIARKRMSK
jgi:hypothetical protein